MTHTKRQQLLFSAAIDIFLRHTLCETQLLYGKTKTLQRLGNFTYADGLFHSCGELCKLLKKIVERKNHSTGNRYFVYYDLALVDRWNECIIWSEISDKCPDPRDCVIFEGSKVRGSWLPCLVLAQQSAYCLTNARRAANGQDVTLAADWVTVSSLSDAAARQCALYKNPNICVSERRCYSYFPAECIEACKLILELLEKFPEIVVGGIESLVATVKFKKAVAEGIVTAVGNAEDQRMDNTVLVREWTAVRNVAASVLAALQDVYASPYQLLHERETCCTNMAVLNSLLSASLELLEAVDACTAFVGEWKTPVAEILRGTQTAMLELPAVKDQVSPLSQPTSSAVATRFTALSDRVAELLTAAQEVKSKATLAQKAACPRRTLAQLYDSKAMAARSVSPQTQCHAQLAQCWERAAALVRSATDGNKDLALAGKYAELADGVLSSTVTCHDQHMRAMDSHDARQAQIWCRLLKQVQSESERAMATLSEEADTWSDEDVKRRRNRIVGAVHLASQAMRVLCGGGATLLQRLDADLKLCAADISLLSDAVRMEKLLTVAQNLHGLLHALQRPLVVQGLPDLAALQDTTAVQGVLQSLVGHIYTLADAVATGFAEKESAGKGAWQYSLDAITSTLLELNRADTMPTDLALAVHAVDLSVLTLQLGNNGDSLYVQLLKPAVAMVEGLARMDHGNDPLYPTLTPEQRGRLRCFRLYHALRYEQDVLLPLASFHGPIANFKLLSSPPPDVGPIADLPYEAWGLEVIAASNSAMTCDKQAKLMGLENAEDLHNAAGHYARAATFLSHKAENSVVTHLETVVDGAQAAAVAVSARLALLCARACEDAHKARLAGNHEACALYRKVVETLPAPSYGAQFHSIVMRNNDAIEVLEKVAGFYVHAAGALMNDKRDQFVLWQEAAQICDAALLHIAGKGQPLFTHLRADWKTYVLRADAVAGKAEGVTACKVNHE